MRNETGTGRFNRPPNRPTHQANRKKQKITKRTQLSFFDSPANTAVSRSRGKCERKNEPIFTPKQTQFSPQKSVITPLSSASALPVSVANPGLTMHSVFMPYRPKKKKPQPKAGEPGSAQSRDYQFLDQRRRDFTTRNILSRLRNRKSDIK